MHFTCAARTDVGIVRSGNEDNYLMLADHGIFIVAEAWQECGDRLEHTINMTASKTRSTAKKAA